MTRFFKIAAALLAVVACRAVTNPDGSTNWSAVQSYVRDVGEDLDSVSLMAKNDPDVLVIVQALQGITADVSSAVAARAAGNESVDLASIVNRAFTRVATITVDHIEDPKKQDRVLLAIGITQIGLRRIFRAIGTPAGYADGLYEPPTPE